jgi:hypothetical protein
MPLCDNSDQFPALWYITRLAFSFVPKEYNMPDGAIQDSLFRIHSASLQNAFPPAPGPRGQTSNAVLMSFQPNY